MARSKSTATDEAADAPPQPHRSEATVTLKDAAVSVDVKGDERSDGAKVARPFEMVDTESLFVLMHAVKAEAGSR